MVIADAALVGLGSASAQGSDSRFIVTRHYPPVNSLERHGRWRKMAGGKGGAWPPQTWKIAPADPPPPDQKG